MFFDVINSFPYTISSIRRVRSSAGVDELTQGEILWSHFVNAKVLHLINIERKDGFDQIFRQDIHREYLVILVRHDHRATTTFDTGIQHIFLVTANQPSQIGMACTIFIESRNSPTEELVVVVALRNNMS